MGAFGAWLADLGRKIAIYSPVLILMFGLMLVWSTYQATAWAVLHIPLPPLETVQSLFSSFAEVVSSNSLACWLLNLFAIDYLLSYLSQIYGHMITFITAIATLFTCTLSLMLVAYTYGRSKALASVLAGEKLL